MHVAARREMEPRLGQPHPGGIGRDELLHPRPDAALPGGIERGQPLEGELVDLLVGVVRVVDQRSGDVVEIHGVPRIRRNRLIRVDHKGELLLLQLLREDGRGLFVQ